MGGTLDKAPAPLVSASTSSFGAVGTWKLCEPGACTPLGPEGPEPTFVGSEPLGLLLSPLVGVGEGYRPYFENYTVDASIFSITFGWCCNDDLKDH